ncbi:MAG: AAA family ATPase [Planctomycetes bacterium]|nr:AAA family ATPase [Planctomycetota bacterium]
MSKEAFLEQYSQPPVTVRTSEGPREVLLLGDVTDPKLPDHLADFVAAVRRFRHSVGAEEEQVNDRWSEFVDWCCEALKWPDFESQERDYKLRVGENMREARRAFLARVPDWPLLLKRGFGSPNNMTPYFTHEPFYQWAEAHPEEAAIALDHLWSEGRDPIAGIDEFCAAVPRDALKHGIGTHLNIASALLMGRDASRWTIYKHRLNGNIFRVSGTPLPRKGASASEVYSASVSLFERLAEAMRENGAQARDPLDAQSAAYSILRNEHFFQSLAPEARAELMHFIGRDEETSDSDEPATAAAMDQPRRSHPLNQILYGPPGTGKTYRTRELALEICGIDADEDSAQLEYKKLIESGRVGFVTFHQSYSYEDFVEGIRPDLDNESASIRYELKDGIFKTMCARARRFTSPVATTPRHSIDGARVWKMSLKSSAATSEDLFQDCVSGSCILLGWGEDVDLSEASDRASVIAAIEKVRGKIRSTSYEITAVHLFRNEMQVGDIVVVPDGSQRVRAIGRVTGPYAGLDEATDWHKRPVEWLAIFEPSIPREELGATNRFSAQTIYSLPADRIDRAAVATLIAQASQGDVDLGTALPCVLIIDEINRANVSKVLGELITLIEPDKRLGARNELEVTLPYSRQRFGVPSNLYLVGTMNTADRSIAFLDVALRRRFTFTELMPDPALVDEHVDVPGISAGELLRCMNERIELLLDRDHTIGHAYFFEVDSLRQLRDRFTRRIIPLLQEYFYQDGRKVAQVLGCGVDEAGRSNHEHPIMTATSRSADKVIGPDADDFDTLLTFKVNEQFANAGPDELPLYFRGILDRVAN